MGGQKIEAYRVISVNHLVKAVEEGRSNSERFCFILGSGASVSSGIPAGVTLECDWMKDMEAAPGLEEVRQTAKALRDNHRLEHDFEEIERAWEETKKSGNPFPSEFYFDIYKLRFFPNHRNGYHYLEKIMGNKTPGFGYHPLALMLTEGTGNNLVITTNFDSLVEDALFLYTDSKPLVINHELLADYAGDPNIKRPIIAKIHRGIFFDPLNQPEETNQLKGRWHDVLASVFQSYTPIVIGYGGGDNSLMKLLEESSVKMKNGIYWCYMEKHGLPNEKIQSLVREKNGYLVRTAGFDATMLAIGNALFPDKIGVHETENYLSNRINTQIINYEREYKRLVEHEEARVGKSPGSEEPANESEDEFRREIEKMAERGAASEKERRERNQMTAWDYWREGNEYMDQKQYDKVVESYSEAIRLQADAAQFYMDRGYAYSRLKDYDKAISDYNRVLELDPLNGNAYAWRGNFYEALGDYDKALSDCGKALELEPKNYMAHLVRSSVYQDLGDYDRAIAELEYREESTQEPGRDGEPVSG